MSSERISALGIMNIHQSHTIISYIQIGKKFFILHKKVQLCKCVFF